jgi:hypothetical protein
VAAALGVAGHVLAALGEEHVLLERAAGAGDAVLEVADDVVEVDEARLDQRAQGELDGGGVAPGPATRRAALIRSR